MAIATTKSRVDEVLDRIKYLDNKYGFVDIHELYGMLRGQVDPHNLTEALRATGHNDRGNGRWELPSTSQSFSSLQSQLQNQLQSMIAPSLSGLPVSPQMNYHQVLQQAVPVAGSGGTATPSEPMKSRYKYQVGDLVKITGNNKSSYDEHYFPIGSIGKVVDVDPGCVYLEPAEGTELPEGVSVPQRLPYKWVEKATIMPKPKITIDSVIIPEDKKEQIRVAISQAENTSKIFEEWGFSDVFEKGTAISLLFWGIPGTGKTLMAQAIADTLDLKLKIYGTGDIESSEPGGAERMIKQIFAEAKKATEKRLILFDECDSLLMDRNEVGAILGAQVNALLSEIERYEGVIIFTTNRLGKLDPALERRITTKIEFEFPSVEARKQIWERLIPKKAPLAEDVDFKKLAEYAIAGGNIKNAVLNAVRTAAYQKAKQLTMEHFSTTAKREVESVKAFMREYDDNVHQQQHGFVGREANGSLKLEKRADKQIKIEKRLKLTESLGGTEA